MERHVIRGGREGYQRLQVLAAARRPRTLEFLELAGLRPGMRCVDLGCGGGAVSLELAQLAGPARWWAWTWIRRSWNWPARPHASVAWANVVFAAGDVNAWGAPGEYDLVYCRFLLDQPAARTQAPRRPAAGTREVVNALPRNLRQRRLHETAESAVSDVPR